MFMALALCLTLLPAAAFAEGEDDEHIGGVIGGGETGGEGGGVLCTTRRLHRRGRWDLCSPGTPNRRGRRHIYPRKGHADGDFGAQGKPSSIQQRSYDGTTDGSTIPIDLTFTDGTDTFTLKEGTGFNAKKTFDSLRTWVIIKSLWKSTLIGETAKKYKLKAGEETFTIGGYIDKATPELTVSLSKAACTVGEKLLPLLSVSGVQENAAVTYFYTPIKTGYLEFEDSNAVPKIDENTAISEAGTYYVYAKTDETKNYEVNRSGKPWSLRSVTTLLR